MPGLIPPATLEQIRAACDIVEVIGGYVPLKRAGANFTALCPFHREKSPSFNVNPHKQIFHCFGCHKGGDVFTFVKDYENIGFLDAVRRLAERAKIPLNFENSPGQQQAREIKDVLRQIHDQIAQRWHAALLNDAAGQIARDYLAKRGVSAEAIKLFRLGYAPDKWDDTVNWAKSKNHDLALVEQGGLILKREGADGHYDRFRGRLIFPICDEQGRIVGFSGRILTGDEKTAKYVNSPETPIFTKGKVIFGLDKSRRALLDKQFAIICEGQLDLIACFMAGVQNVVAPQGTALTADHTRILKRYVNEVVLCFDSDNAGQKAAVRSLDILLASGLAIRVATLPSPHDPDSYIKANGAAAFEQLIQNAEGFFDYYLNRLCAQNDVATDKGRAAVLKAMAEAVHKTGDAVLADKHAQKTALRLGVAVEATRAEFRKISRGGGPTAPSADEEAMPETEEIARPPQTELWLLKLLLNNDSLAAWAERHLDPAWIAHPLVREIVSTRLATEREQSWHSVAEFAARLEGDAARSLLTEALAESRALPQVEQQLADVTLRLRNQFIDRQVAELTRRVSDPACSDAEQEHLIRERHALQQTKRQQLSTITSPALQTSAGR
ncbi:MAG: DNA primase [Verrucomicrobia bacterium]|nr:DNA primase [Verrucomicrobiota bacterium]